ncbi:MAG: alpha/beta hydrolase [Leptolyngbyaceae cyanobacterium]
MSQRWWKRLNLMTTIAAGCLAVEATTALSAKSAEYLQIGLGLFSLSVPITDLETFAKTGQTPDSLNTYFELLPAAAEAQLREGLTRKFPISPVAVSQVTYASIGEDFLHRLGTVIQTPSGLNGEKAIRAALILAAADPEGFSILGFLEAFPTVGIHVDGGRLLTLQTEVEAYFSYRDAALAAITAQSESEIAATFDQVDWDGVPDLRDRGDHRFDKTVLKLRNEFPGIPPDQPRIFEVDFYQPERSTASTPLVIISHGLGSNRAQFSTMAQHLASYGFAVAVPTHPGSDTDYQQEFLANLSYEGISPTEFIYRPWDVKTIINVLAAEPAYQGQLDLNNVGVIGHSFGGYTALAIAGAPLNQDFIQATCDPVQYVLNLSTLLQCRAALLPMADYDLADERVRAVIAYSPITSVLLGPENLAQISKPVMMVTGSSDFIAPAIPEQIHPFLWLETPDKYLATFVSASHVSINGEVEFSDQVDISPQVSSLVTGPDPNLSSRYAHALNAAFMGFHLSDRPNYEQFLGAAYAAEYLSEEPVELKVISDLRAEQLIDSYGGQPPIAIYPEASPLEE